MSIAEKIQGIRQSISRFESRYQRPPGSVRLLAVSKTQPAAAIREALACGQRDFGENYLQEAEEKQQTLSGEAICWHFIGPIQSNKTRAIASLFQWVHSVDREKIAQRLSAQRPPELPPLNLLLQVNVSGEASKAGVSLTELPELAKAVQALPNISLRGLMAIPAPEHDFQRQRQAFRLLAQARDALVAAGLEDCRELSMGMSQDFEAAIAEGATLIRIGSDIFGPRQKSTA